MNLVSKRLIYIKVNRSEFSNYLKWYTNDLVMKFITGRGLHLEEARLRFEKALDINEKHPELGFYTVKDKNENTFVGIAKLVYLNEYQAEVGYGSMPEFWDQKYASEMLDCLINYSKEIPKIKELIAVVNEDNLASKKVLTKQNFKFYEKKKEEENILEWYKLVIRETT